MRLWMIFSSLLLVTTACGDDDGSSMRDSGTRRDARGGGVDSAVPEGCEGPLDAPIPGCTPTPVPNTGDPYADCVARINQFRAECQCLPPLERWTEGEDCADEQAEYDSTRSPHAGFSDRICDGGNAQNECPGWRSIDTIIGGCLQSMWDEGPGEPFSEHGHYINMSNTRYSRVACGFFTTPDGRIWSVQNFR